mgnify:CR=1 FL=1
MRKKWTYVAIFSMMLGMAPVFTGCIDTDEPAGLEDLRVAKSELLRAKAAVEAARVAEVQANAALIQAQAKTEEARARNEAALAAINEAKAKQEEAIAELKNIDNEAARAELEEQIKQYQRNQQAWELEMAKAQQDAINAQKAWELQYKNQEVLYQKALVELAGAKATLAKEQQAALQPYINAVKDARDFYRVKAEAVTDALRTYNKAVAIVEEDKEFLQRQLDWAIVEAERSLAGAQEAKAEAEAQLADAENIKGSDIANKQAELQKEIDQINQNVINLSVQAAEEMRKIFETDYAAYMELVESRSDFLARKLTTSPIEITISNHFPWSVNFNSVKIEEKEYTVADVISYNGYGTDGYAQALYEMEVWLDQFKQWERDENDNEWTKETISRLEYDNKTANTELTKKQAAWQDAVDAYKVGSYPEYDATQIEGYSKLDEAVTAYNTQVKKYNEAANAIAAAQKTMQDAQDGLPGLLNAAQDAFNKAKAAAEKARNEATAALPTRFTEEEKKRDNLEAAMEAAQKALQADPTNEVLAAAYQSAITAYNAQVTICNTFMSVEGAKITATYEAAMTTAQNDLAAAQKKAQDDVDKIVEDAETTIKSNEANLKAAEKELAENVVLDLTEKFIAYDTNASEQGIPYDVVLATVDDINAAYNGSKVVGNYTLKDELTIKQLTTLDRDALRAVIIARSNYLFGTETYGDNAYGDIDARLIPLTVKDVTEKVDAKAAEEELFGWDYLNLFDSYGLVGQIAKREAMIEVAESWLTNGDELAGMIKPLQEAYDALVAQQETYKAEEEARTKDITAKWNEVDEKRLATLEPIFDEQEKLQPVLDVMRAVQSALTDMIRNSADGAISTSDVDAYVDYCENLVHTWEKNVYEAETGVLKAKQDREDWNSGAKDWVTMCAEALEDAQQDLAEAQEDLATANATLQAVLESMSLGTSTTTGEEVTE